MAAYGLGATRWEAVLAVIVPTAVRGIVGGVVLAFGRALGETMAVAMLVGNANQISLSLFAPANTLASLMASNFPEAGGTERDALMFAGLKVATVLAMIGAVVGDYFGGSTRALGVQIENSISLFDLPFGWAAIVVASVFGIAFYCAVGFAERLALRGTQSTEL
jgi:ABC-type nitrate/sulfonate/bicarbonate transport system permease component